jgi:hypothetical protein
MDKKSRIASQVLSLLLAGTSVLLISTGHELNAIHGMLMAIWIKPEE